MMLDKDNLQIPLPCITYLNEAKVNHTSQRPDITNMTFKTFLVN